MDEMEEKAKSVTEVKMEIKAKVLEQLNKIKDYSELLPPLMDKIAEFTDEDLTNAFDMASGIEEEGENLIRLLFDIRDLLERQKMESEQTA